ncbi:hypothetical protein SDC9_117822 [bioreactor metagenome]|uniref:Uncharacterized protein n=1 Tax=bioreactor metagenome TaxID=1076179 RepID=A0A645C1Q5_9ZZZZ
MACQGRVNVLKILSETGGPQQGVYVMGRTVHSAESHQSDTIAALSGSIAQNRLCRIPHQVFHIKGSRVGILLLITDSRGRCRCEHGAAVVHHKDEIKI